MSCATSSVCYAAFCGYPIYPLAHGAMARSSESTPTSDVLMRYIPRPLNTPLSQILETPLYMYMYLLAGLVPPPQAPGNKSHLSVINQEELKVCDSFCLHPPHTHTLPHCPSHTSLISNITSLPLSQSLSLFSPPISSITCMYMYLYMYIYMFMYMHVHLIMYNYGVVHVYTHIHVAKFILLSLSLPISPSIPHSLSFYPSPSLCLSPHLPLHTHSLSFYTSPSLSLHLPPSLAGHGGGWGYSIGSLQTQTSS